MAMEHDRMIGEALENLTAIYKNGGVKAPSGDAYSNLYDKDRFSNPMDDERPVRDPDVFDRNPRHVAAP